MLTLNVSYQPTQPSLTPFIDVYDLEDTVIVLADMPGVSKTGIEIRTDGNQLIIRGRCERTNQASMVNWVRLVRECSHCDYYRVLRLSDAIDIEGIQTEMKDGVLRLTFPKRQSAQVIEAPIYVED